jgi:DNA-binding phage protein
MALTRSFRETVALRAAHDGAFRAALLEEALQATLDGELDEAKSLLRDYINATVGFDTLSDATHLPVKSLMRMVGPSGNPTMRNFLLVLHTLQEHSGAKAHVEVAAAPAHVHKPKRSPAS